MKIKIPACSSSCDPLRCTFHIPPSLSAGRRSRQNCLLRRGENAPISRYKPQTYTCFTKLSSFMSIHHTKMIYVNPHLRGFLCACTLWLVRRKDAKQAIVSFIESATLKFHLGHFLPCFDWSFPIFRSLSLGSATVLRNPRRIKRSLTLHGHIVFWSERRKLQLHPKAGD